MEFTAKMKITSKADAGDTVLSGKVTCNGKTATQGSRLTAAEKRGGVTLADAEDALAAKLGLLACRAARP